MAAHSEQPAPSEHPDKPDLSNQASPLHTLPGAVIDQHHPGQLLHFGSPFAEQRALEHGTAITVLADRAIIEVHGPDRLRWLNTLLSQQVSALPPGHTVEALLLSPTGKIEHALQLCDDGSSCWILCDLGSADELLAFLQRMKFRMLVTVRPRTRDFLLLLCCTSPQPLVPEHTPAERFVRDRAATVNGVPLLWRDPWSRTQPGGWQYAAEADRFGGPHPAQQFNVLIAAIPRDVHAEQTAAQPASPPITAEQLTAAKLTAAGVLAAETLRVAAWRPRFSTEVDDRALPHEFDWLRSAVHLNKGCYRGQETVAKVHNLGHPPRRLVLLHLDGSESEQPAPGDFLCLAGSSADPSIQDAAPADSIASAPAPRVGKVTSVGWHFELGLIALALVKRTADTSAVCVVECVREDGSVVRIPATVVDIVPASAGSVAQVPRIRRSVRDA